MYKNTRSTFYLINQAKKDRIQAITAIALLTLGTILTGLKF